MTEIPEVGIRIGEINVRSRKIKIAEIRPWEIRSPVVNRIGLDPITNQIGRPIVEIPGCVEARQSNNMELLKDDPKGNLTLCDGSIPYFRPIQFEPEVILETPKAKVDTIKKEEPIADTSIIKEIPKTPPIDPPPEDKIECPTQELLDEQPVGLIFDSGRKEVTGYRLEGRQCIVETKDVTIVEQAVNALPPTETVVTTASIAVVATTSALMAKPLADILLRVVKPVTKKVVKKIASIRGKTVKVESVEERRAAQRDRVGAIQTLKKALKK
jgi:hypothetical protein